MLVFVTYIVSRVYLLMYNIHKHLNSQYRHDQQGMESEC